MRRWLAVAGLVAAITLICIEFPASATTGQSTSVRCGGYSCSDRLPKIQFELDQAVALGVPGIVWYERVGDTVTVLTAGEANVPADQAIAAQDRFRIASSSKTFLAATVLRLVDQGRLRLDDRVTRWFPSLLPNKDITVRQLLQHTSGLYSYDDDANWQAAVSANLDTIWQARQLVRIGTAHPSLSRPGKEFHYSNTGYIVLGMIIEAVTGESEGKAIEDQVLGPLGLRNTYVATGTRILGPHAHGYTPTGDGMFRDVTAMSATLAGASGNIISTVSDVAHFERALLAGHLLPADLLKTMEATIPTGDGQGFGYGLGLATTPQACGTSYGHGGGIYGFSSDAEQMADGRRQVVVYANTDNIPWQAFAHFAKATRLSLCGS